MSGIGDLGGGNQNAFNAGNIYPNAFFDYLSRLLPRKLKGLFQWIEYLYVNCGQVFSVIKKFSEYPITQLTYDHEDKEAVKKIDKIMDESIKIKRCMISVGIDYQVYGNSFSSIFKPFIRYLVCKKCDHKVNARKTKYEWMPQKFEFKIKCTKCKHKGVAKVEHAQLKDVSKVKVIRWDPKEIDIDWNPVTGEKEFYYTIPNEIKSKIKAKKPSKFLIDTMPWAVLEAIRDKRIFKFHEGQLFHMANPAPAGLNQEWGYPGLLGCLKPFFYTAILRKANEANALERLTPWRVLHPQPSTGSNDPGQFVNLARWRTEMQDAVRKWRRDPNMVKLSPIPVGITEVGGNARPLLTHQEISLTEENIITSMGVPKEFIHGGLTHAGGSVTLRMLENMMFTYTEQLVEFAQWVTNAVCAYTGLEKPVVGMVPFKLIDDIQQKQLMSQLWQQQKLSAKTFLKTLEVDPELENKYLMEESVSAAQLEKELNEKLKAIQSNLATEVDDQLTGNPLQYDPNAVMGMAQQEAQTLASLPEAMRKDRVQQLEMQDPVLAILAQKMLTEFQKQQQAQGSMQMQGGQSAMQGGSINPGGSSPSTSMTGQ